jgi:hypothetical protein
MLCSLRRQGAVKGWRKRGGRVEKESQRGIEERPRITETGVKYQS